MLSGDLIVRHARPSDALRMADMANAFNATEGKGSDQYHEFLILREVFGPDPSFSVLVCEIAGHLAGYLSYQNFFNSELARRGYWMLDLYVDDAYRQRGCAKAMMAELCHLALERGIASVWWGCWTQNTRARQVYANLGAVDEDARILEFVGDGLARLAALAQPFTDAQPAASSDAVAAASSEAVREVVLAS